MSIEELSSSSSSFDSSSKFCMVSITLIFFFFLPLFPLGGLISVSENWWKLLEIFLSKLSANIPKASSSFIVWEPLM